MDATTEYLSDYVDLFAPPEAVSRTLGRTNRGARCVALAPRGSCRAVRPCSRC